MSQAKRLSKIKFYSISRDIRDGRRSNVEMAEFHGVSTGTIRTVRVSKTWKGFEEHKKAQNAKAVQRKVELGKARAAAHRIRSLGGITFQEAKSGMSAAAATLKTKVSASAATESTPSADDELGKALTPLFTEDRLNKLTERLEDAIGRLNSALFKLENGMVEPQQRRRSLFGRTRS